MAGPSTAAARAPRLAILMLCHESPAQLARRLASPFFQHPDVALYIHYDAARGPARLAELAAAVPPQVRARFVEPRVRCHWGDHTLVEATRRMMALALADDGFRADHLALVSGSCVPFRPVASLQRFLAERPGTEFIQAQPVGGERWVKDGLEQERYEFYFPFNFRTRRAWFEWATARQREFGIRRAVPSRLAVHFGSQWFCLTRATAAQVTERLSEPAIRHWLRWSWIPDEFAIQTLVAAACPPGRIAGHNLTYYEFDPKGQPLILDNDHFDHLLSQPFFFARKLAPEAQALEQRIHDHVRQDEPDLGYLTRVGRATSAYARHIAEATSGTAPQAHVGTVMDLWRGPMETNRRRYYVLHAASRTWLEVLLQAARQRAAADLPLFSFPFDRWVDPAQPGDERLGFGRGLAPRRDHDPQAFLFEMVNAHTDQPCAFALDVARPGKLRDFIRWDRPAVLIDCNPPLTREQRALALLDGLTAADDAPVIEAALAALRDGSALPGEAYLNDIAEAASCQTATLRDFGPALGDQTLSALRGAYHELDPTRFHAEAGAAWRRFWK